MSFSPYSRFIPPLGPPRRSRSQRVLAQWRGIDVVTLEKGQALRAQPVSALMPKVLSGLRMDRRRAEAEVVKVWNHLLDPRLQHSFGTDFVARISFRVG